MQQAATQSFAPMGNVISMTTQHHTSEESDTKKNANGDSVLHEVDDDKRCHVAETQLEKPLAQESVRKENFHITEIDEDPRSSSDKDMSKSDIEMTSSTEGTPAGENGQTHYSPRSVVHRRNSVSKRKSLDTIIMTRFVSLNANLSEKLKKKPRLRLLIVFFLTMGVSTVGCFYGSLYIKDAMHEKKKVSDC